MWKEHEPKKRAIVGSPLRATRTPEIFVESILFKFQEVICEGLIITSLDKLVLYAENLIRI